MSLTQITFWTLLHSQGVRIPIIQRDYAQGREDAAVIRNKFVHSLYQTLQANDSNSPLDLDFVYGEVKHPKDAKQRYLVPLDGQQRLTTLYLLHWYLATADGRLADASQVLRKFTYQTRSSSREFCECLATCDIDALDLDGCLPLSQQLRDAVWFQSAWQRDPTVRAMLTMLDALADKFGPTPGLFDRLINADEPLITFQFLELDKVGLTDDLYLKMNARGKPLTEFENWKAEFDQFLTQHYPARQMDFAHKVDGAWTDLFWHHQQGDPAQMDVAFKRFLDYITIMLGQLPSAIVPLPDETADPFDRYRQVYKNVDHVDFLFTALDLLSQASVRDTTTFFSGLLAPVQTVDRVALFEGDTNLFVRVINADNDDIRVRVLLFAVLYYGVQVGQLDGAEPNLQDLVRVLRNQMERVRQLKQTRYGLVLREADIPTYLADLVALVPQNEPTLQSVYAKLANNKLPRFRNSSRFTHEVEKARILIQHPHLRAAVHQLEDLPVFRGNLENLDVEQNELQLPEMANAAKAIWASGVQAPHIIRGWLTIGDYALHTGNSALGPRYFLGSHDNWYPVLVAQDNHFITPFLLAYTDAPGNTPTERLQMLAVQWLESKPVRDWRYYFVKYPAMARNETGQFTWDGNYQIQALSSSSLRAFHINPYVQALVHLVKDENKCTEQDSGTNDAYEWPLRCRRVPTTKRAQSVGIYCQNEGWYVELPKGYALENTIAEAYKLDAQSPGHFMETASRDHLQIALAFVRDLYKYGLVKMA